MTDLEKAARMALEALGYYEVAGLATTRVAKSITALRQALEQPEYASDADTEELTHLNSLPEPLRLAAMLEKTMQWPLHGKAADCLRKMHAALSEQSAQQQEPEFIKHEVKNADDWSEWVCPDPKGYQMKCCDCGLVHEAQFGVVRYKSENEREDCEKVDDPNLQAVFRMRRSEQWSPYDTAHRAGGLPMEQPQDEWLTGCPECGMDALPSSTPSKPS